MTEADFSCSVFRSRRLTVVTWLSVTPTPGNIRFVAPASLVVTADPSALTPGTYTGRISIAGPDRQVIVPVTVTVTEVQRTIVLSQTGLAFTAVSGGGVVPPQS